MRPDEVPAIDVGGGVTKAQAYLALEADIDSAGLRWYELPPSALAWRLTGWRCVTPVAMVRTSYIGRHSLLRRFAGTRLLFQWLSFATWDSYLGRYCELHRIRFGWCKWTPFCTVSWMFW